MLASPPPSTSGIAGGGVFSSNFSQAFSRLLDETGVTCYQIAKYTGIDEGYLSRLRSGEKRNPSPEIIARICLAIAHLSNKTTQPDFEALFNSVGRSLLIKH